MTVISDTEHVLYTYADLQTLCTANATRHMTGFVADRIVIPSTGFRNDCADYSLQLIGVTPRAGFDLSRVETALTTTGSGDSKHYTEAIDGVNLVRTSLLVQNLEFLDYNQRGAALHPECSRSYTIIGNRFRRCGAKKYPYSVVPLPSGADSSYSVYNEAIVSHQDAAVVNIHDNLFESCSLSEARWSHVLYLDELDIFITNNLFYNCGQPYTLNINLTGHDELNRQVVRSGNIIAAPGLCKERTKDTGDVTEAIDDVYHYSLAEAMSRSVTCLTKYSGRFRNLYNGYPTEDKSVIDFNTYSGCTIQNAANVLGVGTKTFQWLRDHGFEVNSKL